MVRLIYRPWIPPAASQFQLCYHPALDVDRLIADLLSDQGYASGRRAYPRSVSLQDTLAVVARLYAEVDRGTAARADAAAAQNVRLACGRGCNACCAEPIMVLVPTAIAVAVWLTPPENTVARDRFMAAYPGWREAVGDSLDALAELRERGDVATRTAAHAAHQLKRILCPFNHEGLCTIYPVRPVVCRNGHAVDSAGLLRRGSSERKGGDPAGLRPARRLPAPGAARRAGPAPRDRNDSFARRRSRTWCRPCSSNRPASRPSRPFSSFFFCCFSFVESLGLFSFFGFS